MAERPDPEKILEDEFTPEGVGATQPSVRPDRAHFAAIPYRRLITGSVMLATVM